MFFLWSYVTWGAWDLGQNLGYVICQVGSKRMPMSPEPSVYYKINTHIYIHYSIYIYMVPPQKPMHPLILLLFTVNSTYFGTYFSKAKN